MIIFVINLEKDSHKKETFIKNFNKFNLDYEFIKAVYGKGLSEYELDKLVYDYKNSFITFGEIGCALSHLKIYQKMINEDIKYALILEDDALCSDEFLKYLNQIEQFLKTKKDYELVCVMYKMDEYFKNLTIKISDNINIYKFAKGTGTYGYIITKKAAKKLIKINTPLILEADCWVQFFKMDKLKIYCLDKNIIETSDPFGINSSIEQRDVLGKQKSKARKKRLRKFGGIKYLINGLYYRLTYKVFNRSISN